MKVRYSFLIFSVLVFSCDFGVDLGGLNDWHFPFIPYKYTADVQVHDVNSDTCFDAMLIFDNDTRNHYPDPTDGWIRIIHTDSVENDPHQFSRASKVYMNRWKPTIFKQVDIIFQRGNFGVDQIVKFDVPK